MPPDLLRKLKEKAAHEGRSMQDLANELLRDGLARMDDPPRFELRMLGWEADEQAGVDLLDRDKLFDLMEGE